jgi:hypothetical protein
MLFSFCDEPVVATAQSRENMHNGRYFFEGNASSQRRARPRTTRIQGKMCIKHVDVDNLPVAIFGHHRKVSATPYKCWVAKIVSLKLKENEERESLH